MPGEDPDLRAVIGVSWDGEETLYVKRSAAMQNYPSVWSLPSIQYTQEELPDPTDLAAAQGLFSRMAEQRFYSAPIRVWSYLTAGEGRHETLGLVHLDLYLVDFLEGLDLNPDYYSDYRWMDFSAYRRAVAGMKCGLCTRLWQDHAFLLGLADSPFEAEE